MFQALEARGIPASDGLRRRVLACGDAVVLGRRLGRALAMDTAAEALDEGEG